MVLVVIGIIGLFVSFYLLAVVCDEFFVPSLDRISEKLKLNSDVAGATLMAAGSSAPEFFTSLIAVFRPGGLEDVGSGTIVGSAIFNILVIIGASALFRAVKLHWQPVVRDTLFYILTIVLLLFVFWDGKVVLSESILFISVYGVYILTVLWWKKFFPYKDVDPIDLVEKEQKTNSLAKFSKRLLSCVIPDVHRYKNLFLLTFFLSIAWIAGLSYVLVESVVVIADFFHVNPTFLALTVLAAGTSIPDLLSSVIVAKQGRGDMAVSNAVGSNIFDILFGLGVPWFIVLSFRGGSVPVGTENLLGSVFLLFATVLAIVFLLLVRNWRIGQKSGLILIGIYVLYVIYTFMTVA
ncbi:MAG: calcium/sodium antiporter [Patescibacteria group bacterium]|nr:calcium/sodium antiporter [Patescibacteria group bacterium]